MASETQNRPKKTHFLVDFTRASSKTKLHFTVGITDPIFAKLHFTRWIYNVGNGKWSKNSIFFDFFKKLKFFFFAKKRRCKICPPTLKKSSKIAFFKNRPKSNAVAYCMVSFQKCQLDEKYPLQNNARFAVFEKMAQNYSPGNHFTKKSDIIKYRCPNARFFQTPPFF